MQGTNKSLFYNSENGDRVYDADSFEHLLKNFFTSGVFQGSCQVTADGSGMTCSVGTGYAFCDGKVRIFDEETELSFDNAHATYNRIDTVVVERNDTDREITIKVVKGTYSETPEAEEPVRSGGIYQMVLAEVYIAAGSTYVGQTVITDKRPDADVCGWVICAVQTPDFSQLYAQFQEQASDFIETMSEDFDSWFEGLQNALEGNVAANLQNEISALSEEIDDMKDGIFTVNTTIAGNGWTAGTSVWTNKFAVTGVLTTDSPIVDVDMSDATSSNYQDMLTNWGKIARIATDPDDDGYLVAYTFEAPTQDDIDVIVRVVR